MATVSNEIHEAIMAEINRDHECRMAMLDELDIELQNALTEGNWLKIQTIVAKINDVVNNPIEIH